MTLESYKETLSSLILLKKQLEIESHEAQAKYCKANDACKEAMDKVKEADLYRQRIETEIDQITRTIKGIKFVIERSSSDK